MSENVKDVELVKIGDIEYDYESITPSHYFDYVKGLKQTLNKEEYGVIIDTGLTMLKKTQVTGQKDMAKKITDQINLCLRELDAADKGFDIFVERKEIEKYIEAVEGKSIKIIELSRYSREIPDEIMDRIILAKEIFDEIYIVFTDYTLEETKKVAKERRDKDPIAFGAFKNDGSDSFKPYVEDRLFFIADWVEELCDLTLDEIIKDVRNREKKEITYVIETPKDIDQVKDILKSYESEEPIIKPTKLTIAEKLKRKMTLKNKSNKDEEVTTPVKKRRGRPKKKKDDE